MNYLLDKKTIFKNRETKKKTGKILIIAGFILFFYVFGSFIYPPISKIVLSVTRPILSANNLVSQSVKKTVTFFTVQKHLVEQNKTLKNELQQKETALFEAYTKLRSLAYLEVFLPADQDLSSLTIGQVISRPKFMPYDLLLVSVPSGVLVKKGSPVFWSDKIILGEVVDKVDSLFKIRLYSSPGLETAVLIETGIGSSTPATLIGRGGGNFIVRLPRGLTIADSSRVVLAFNPALVVGIIDKVESAAEKPFQVIYIRTPINLYTLNQVIIKNDS